MTQERSVLAIYQPSVLIDLAIATKARLLHKKLFAGHFYGALSVFQKEEPLHTPIVVAIHNNNIVFEWLTDNGVFRVYIDKVTNYRWELVINGTSSSGHINNRQIKFIYEQAYLIHYGYKPYNGPNKNKQLRMT